MGDHARWIGGTDLGKLDSGRGRAGARAARIFSVAAVKCACILEGDDMAWKKNSAQAIHHFDEVAAVPGAARKIMFGCPVYELHGQRYAMLHENKLVLRLSPKHAAELIAKGGRTWEPMKGRTRKDRIVVPDAVADNARSLRAWVQRAAKHAHSE
jgi:hypothetical protein